MKNLSVLVLTGGPCAGKTTAIEVIAEWLRDLGIGVAVLKEAPTELIAAGFKPGVNISPFDFQKELIRYMIEREEMYRGLLEKTSADTCVLLCDRGIRDALAYMPGDQFESVLSQLSRPFVNTGDTRYDAVFHLVTAADGAESFYTHDNNASRLETAAEARVKDQLTQHAWMQHPRFFIVDNSTDFTRKLKRLWAFVCRSLEYPEPICEERKFLVHMPDFSPQSVWDTQKITAARIEQTYLKSSDNETEIRIRRREQNGHRVHYLTHKRIIDGRHRRIETEKRISESEYVYRARNEADPTFGSISKIRYCFLWNNQYGELDVFQYPRPAMCLMKITLTKEQPTLIVPPFIDIMKEITDNSHFLNREIARI